VAQADQPKHSTINWRSRIVRYDKIRASEITPHPQNPRRHPQFQRDVVAASFEELGQIAPIVINVNNGYLVDGEERSWLALDQDDDVELDVIYVDLTEEEHQKALLYLDHSASLAEIDAQRLDDLLRDVNSDQPAIQQMLAELAENNGLYGDEGSGADDPGAQIDRAAELQEQWQVKRGDLWIIPSKSGKGEHRLLCGDSTDADDVTRVMAGEKSGLMVTDPPYNVAQDTELYAQNRSKALKELAQSDWDYGFDPLLFLEATKDILAPDSWQYVFTAHHMFGAIFEWLNTRHAKAGFCVWCKPNPMPSLTKRTWTFAVELCLFGKSGSPIFNFPDDGHCLNWWAINKLSDGNHPTQKPVEVISHIIDHCSVRADIVVDCFCGSGTTIVACEQLGRQARTIEIEPKYVAVTLERLKQMGLEPQLSEVLHEVSGDNRRKA